MCAKNNTRIYVAQTSNTRVIPIELSWVTCNNACSSSLRLFFSPGWSNHCLAALDLGADVEQPFGCLIVQNRQAMHSMGRSIDWTLKDNMVDGLFICATLTGICATLTGRRGGHTPLYKQERKRPTPVRSQLGLFLGGVIPGGECRSRGWKCGVLWDLSAHSACQWWSAHCAARVLLLPDKLMRCVTGTNGCLDLRHRAFALDGGWALGGADIQAPWHGVLETLWLHCDEAQQVECMRGLEGRFTMLVNLVNSWLYFLMVTMRVIYTVACCHSVKLCAHAARAFRSQQQHFLFRRSGNCTIQDSPHK